MKDKDKAETTAETTTETVTEPAAETPEKERVFTQAEVTDLLKKERAKGKRSGRAEARQEIEAQREKPAASKAPANSEPNDVIERVQSLEQQLERERQDRQFSEALLQIPNAKLNDARKRALRAVFDPDNPGAIVDEYAELFGGTEAAGGNSKPEAAPPGVPAVVASAESFNPGAPAAAPRDLPDNPLKWSKSDYERVRARGGREALNKIETWRGTLPGGAPSMFRRKIPKG